MFHYPCGPDHHELDYGVPELEELCQDNMPMSRYDILNGDQIHIEILPQGVQTPINSNPLFYGATRQERSATATREG